MSKSLLLLLLITMSLGLLADVVIPQAPTFVGNQCYYDAAYDQDEYALNLRNLLTDLNNKAYQFGSYSNSTGSGANKVYGQYYCRADIDANLCGLCVQEASNSSDCILDFPNFRGTIWYEECTLRYDNSSFVGILDVQIESINVHTDQYQTASNADVMDTEKFGRVLNNTMEKIISKAAYENGSLHFATGEGLVSDNETVFCLVQCSPDLNNTQCYTCLQAIYEYCIPVNGRAWVRFLSMYVSSCQMRYSNYGAFYRLPNAPPPQQTTPNGKESKIASYYVLRAVIPAIAVGLLAILAIFIYLLGRNRVLKTSSQNATTKPATDSEIQTTEFVQFDLESIDSATNSFSFSNKLGQGGFGIVYQGTLNDGQTIAVKRLSKGSVQGTNEFKTEVAILAKLHHKNLVELVGFCIDGDERLLVYEFLSNLSLDRFIFDPIRSAYLTWPIRFNIIQGIVRGLHYLHEDSRVKIVHRDLKTSNVLLDDNLDPKIADFGMARLVKLDQTTGNTSKVVGTYGYMSPEYALAGRYSTKSDVYSFGVIVLEILSGKNNSLFYDKSQSEGLLQHAWRVWNGGAIQELMDLVIENNYSKLEAERCLQIGLLCVQDDSTCRPSMQEVLVMLNSNTVQLPPPFSPSHSNYIIKLKSGDETQESTSKKQESGSTLSSTTFSAQRDLHAH